MCETLFLILCVRKKFLLNRECPSTTILTECSSERIKQISDKKKNNQRIDEIYVGNSPKECLYDFADNSN